jgi:hypothetical protein
MCIAGVPGATAYTKNPNKGSGSTISNSEISTVRAMQNSHNENYWGDPFYYSLALAFGTEGYQGRNYLIPIGSQGDLLYVAESEANSIGRALAICLSGETDVDIAFQNYSGLINSKQLRFKIGLSSIDVPMSPLKYNKFKEFFQLLKGRELFKKR